MWTVLLSHVLQTDKISSSRKAIAGNESQRTFEVPLEHVARTRAVTEGVRHLEDW